MDFKFRYLVAVSLAVAVVAVLAAAFSSSVAVVKRMPHNSWTTAMGDVNRCLGNCKTFDLPFRKEVKALMTFWGK
jgi:ABC-type sugar transport system substrate-binding protein